MSVPTISGLTPAVGPSMGDMVVRITGTNFRVPTIPAGLTDEAANGPFPQTVLVTFDGMPARDVRCHSSTEITAIPFAHRVGPVDVEVFNLDDNGNAIAGENVTAAAAFTFELPIYTKEAETDLAFTIRSLLQAFKVQLFGFRADGTTRGAVTHAVQTDYDPDLGDVLHVTEFASLPGLTLIGPDLNENRFYSLNEKPTYDDGTVDVDGNPEGFVETRAPVTVDLDFDVVVASDNSLELANLMVAFVQFMHRNKYLFVNRDPLDPSKGQMKYEFDFQPGGHPKKGRSMEQADSNLRSFSAKIRIRGFNIETITGIASGATNGVPNQAIVNRGATVDQLDLDPSIQTGVSSRSGPSPG